MYTSDSSVLSRCFKFFINNLNFVVLISKVNKRVCAVFCQSVKSLYCGVVAQWLGRRTCNQQVAGLSPGRTASRNDTRQVVHTHVLCFPSSINWYRRKLGAKQALHATHQSHVHGFAGSAGVWLRATETEISAALWAPVAWEGLQLSQLTVYSIYRTGRKLSEPHSEYKNRVGLNSFLSLHVNINCEPLAGAYLYLFSLQPQLRAVPVCSPFSLVLIVPAHKVELSQQSLTSHSTHNRSFWRRVFPANHLAMVLTKETYNNQAKYKKPKDLHKKPLKLNPGNKTKLTLV